MTEYTVNDINVLEKDTNPDDPNAFTPLIEVPGKIYNQSYPKRLRHTFPENGKWTTEISFQGQTVKRWKKKVFELYLDV